MTERKPDSIGVFLGLITGEGKVRLQMRTEGGSITGISYKGDFELTGGTVKDKDLRKVLTWPGLFSEAAREAKEELGLDLQLPIGIYKFYRAVYTNPDTGKVDWAFMIPLDPYFWNETVKMKRKTIDVDPDQLNVLGELNLVVSGKKRMWRMAEAAIYMASRRGDWRQRASDLLTGVKPDWVKTELFINPPNALVKMRARLRVAEY